MRRDDALTTSATLLADTQRVGCTADLIHLHCTRAMPGQRSERLIRALAVDLAATSARGAR